METNVKYMANGELRFTVLGSVDNDKLLFDADTVLVTNVSVTGWNTRVTFQVVEPYIPRYRTYVGAKLDDLGYADFKNEYYNQLPDMSMYFTRLSK